MVAILPGPPRTLSNREISQRRPRSPAIGTLPDIDGWEATRRIKAEPATKHIPVVALTANAMSGDREKAIAAGCDDFDTKPVELQRLLGKIRALAPAGSAS